jgi:hypothetical protein
MAYAEQLFIEHFFNYIDLTELTRGVTSLATLESSHF